MKIRTYNFFGRYWLIKITEEHNNNYGRYEIYKWLGKHNRYSQSAHYIISRNCSYYKFRTSREAIRLIKRKFKDIKRLNLGHRNFYEFEVLK